jgi:hypothetical protein
MSKPPRSEIEKLATDSFALAHERIAVEYGTKRKQVLAQVRRKGNIGGYAPALTELAASQVRESILACADAYVEAFTISGVPADASARKSLQTASLRIAGGVNSQVCGQLDLLKKRTLGPLQIPVAYIDGEIGKSTNSALREGLLKLDRQRIEIRSAGKQDSKSGSQGGVKSPDPKASPQIQPLPKLSLATHRKDQERRKNAKSDLTEALESYFSILTSGKEVDMTKLVEIVGAYACEIYNSAAEGYMAIPLLDPEALFGMTGPLNVGLALADVEKCLSALRIRRPWKISSDPAVRLLDDGRELMGLYYEHPWFRQAIGNIVSKRVEDARKEYAEGSESPPGENSGETAHVNDWDSVQSGFMQLRADCAINPPNNPLGRLGAVWTSLPEPGEWELDILGGTDGSGFKERFKWNASLAAALLGYQHDGDAALSYWLDQVKSHAPKQYTRRLVTTGKLEDEDQLYSVELFDICGLSAEFCTKCKADAIRSRAKAEESLKPQAEAQVAAAEESSSERQETAVVTTRPHSDRVEITNAASWDAIKISFLSDVRVQIHNGANTETCNYAELGFKDGRTGNPNQAWLTLRAMAQQNGIIRDGLKTGAAWPKVEKRMQEIRKVLRKHFGVAADPIPFVEGTGYKACFKICCSPSFHT